VTLGRFTGRSRSSSEKASGTSLDGLQLSTNVRPAPPQCARRRAFDVPAQFLLRYLFDFRFTRMLDRNALESLNESSLIVNNVIDTRSEHSGPVRALLGLASFRARGNLVHLVIRRCGIAALARSGKHDNDNTRTLRYERPGPSRILSDLCTYTR